MHNPLLTRVVCTDMAQKKQIPLRLSEKLYNEIAAWAEDEFRSVNGQIEYLLTECVKKHRKSQDTTPTPPDTDEP